MDQQGYSNFFTIVVQYQGDSKKGMPFQDAGKEVSIRWRYLAAVYATPLD
jgi:hypothetical protein